MHMGMNQGREMYSRFKHEGMFKTFIHEQYVSSILLVIGSFKRS